jgi:hypothetical protein
LIFRKNYSLLAKLFVLHRPYHRCGKLQIGLTAACCLFLLLPFNTWSQRAKDFGSVTLEDVSMEGFANDTASAIVLFDIGSIEVEPRSTAGTTERRHVRIKILKADALDEWGDAEFKIPINGILRIKAATYNLEEGVVSKSDVPESSIFRSAYNREIQQVTFPFPNVRAGSVIEFYYVALNPDLYVPGWEFQYSVPMRRSEYTISVPVEKLVYNLRGPLTPAEHVEKYDGKYHHWVFTDVPAFVSEPQMPDRRAYLASVNFSPRFESWAHFFSWFKNNQQFDVIINQYKLVLQGTVNEITAGITDERQKIKAISNYVKQNIRFNGENDFLGLIPGEVFKKKEGTSGEINLILASLLSKAGFDVSMVLLSTRDHGAIDQKLPRFQSFNYVVCEVVTKEGELMVDATDPQLPFDVLPPKCYNHIGFLIGKEKFGWVPVEPKQRHRILLDATVDLQPSGALTGKLTSQKFGYAAYEVRRQLADGGASRYKLTLGDNLWTISQQSMENLEALDKPLIETCALNYEGYATVADNKMYLNPILFLRKTKNPFQVENRSYPIEFEDLADHTEVTTLAIPEGYVVEEMPAPEAAVLPGNAGRFSFSTSQSGNKIVITSSVVFNKTLFMPFEYPALREFYNKLVAKGSQTIVLSRK